MKMTNDRDEDPMGRIRGEIVVSKFDIDGNLVQHFKGENTVMRWTKHALMHLMTGDTFSANGVTRDFTGTHTTSSNLDGTIISGQQFLSVDSAASAPSSGNNVYQWTVPSAFTPDLTTDGNATVNNAPAILTHPYFPTKILLGTGWEFPPGVMSSGSSDSNGAAFYNAYIGKASINGTAYIDSDLSTISGAVTPNGYSSYFNNSSGTPLYGTYTSSAYSPVPTRTMNDIATRDMTNFAWVQESGLTESDGAWAVPGAIKDGTYSGTVDSAKLTTDGNGTTI